MEGSQHFMDSRNCNQNPKCCYDAYDLECPNKFNPPLLSTPTEFCTEALAKGFPIPKCVLAKPKKLQIEREPPPLAKPATSRHLKNWQRWCYIWRQTYNKLTAGRYSEARPPVMCSGEDYRIKKEDKELFDRTLHTYHLTGFYTKNAQFPDSMRPKPCGSSGEIKEVVTKRYVRDFPEMKRYRYPNYVRNENSLPPRKALTNSKGKQIDRHAPPGFNWEERWAKTKHVQKMKKMLACDIDLYGKTDPVPDNLIFTQLQFKGGPSEKITASKKDKHGGDLAVPQLVFSKDTSEEMDESGNQRRTLPTDAGETKPGYYVEFRGPILRIRSEFSELMMTFSQLGVDFPHFIGTPSTSFASTDGEGTNEGEYFYDDDHHFSITTKCKETKFIILKNEGTTAIRYQWFRSPPTYDAQKMLQDPANFKHLKLENDETLQENETGQNITESMTASQTETNPLKKVSKKTHLEFHFCSLPGVILPGQSLEFPIIFRSKRPGFFHETIYLLTHPRLVRSEDGKSYAVNLSGVCTDVELAEQENELHEMEGLRRYLNHKALEEEALDLMDSILDRALWEATNTTAKGSSLPNGRVIAESIFYSHNKDYYYYFGKSEKALEIVHQLIEMLVPRERVETQAECNLSLQSLYNLVLRARKKDDLHWSKLSSSQCEDLLERLNTECMLTLSEQRIFAWPNTARRKYTACYSNLVATIDEILMGFDRLHNLYNAPALKLIDVRKAARMCNEYLQSETNNEGIEEIVTAAASFNDDIFDEVFGELEVDNVPPLESFTEENILLTEEKVEEEEEVEEEETKEQVPYWEAAFEEMMSSFNHVTKEASKPKDKPQKQLPPRERESQSQELHVTDTEVNLADSNARAGSGDAPQTTSTKGNGPKVHTAATLQETMWKQVQDSRRQILTEARVKLFEDLFCAGIERMLATVDNFNNMLDYRDSDAIVILDDKC